MAEQSENNNSTSLNGVKPEELIVIHYPDPRLRKKSQPITIFDDALRRVAARMFELMRAEKGVGLAAAQVGLNIRMFVVNPTGKPEDDKVYVNPELSELEGSEESEEGCLSLPEIRVNVTRPTMAVRMRAQDLSGQPFELAETGFITRVWQHENDHLDGKLILDYMGPVAKMTSRKQLKTLEEEYAARQTPVKKKRSLRLPF